VCTKSYAEQQTSESTERGTVTSETTEQVIRYKNNIVLRHKKNTEDKIKQTLNYKLDFSTTKNDKN